VRVSAAVAAVLTIAAGLAVRGLADGVFAKYAGDALYTVLLFTLVLVAAPRVRPAVAAALALAASWVVEFAQLTGGPAELSTAFPPARLVLGTSFNAPDLFWYAVGAGLAWVVTVLGVRRLERAPAD
jgi:hypothetical protein